jgi:hypothetical protein
LLEETLVALASTAGTTLVAAMATEAWQGARNGIAGLFGRAGTSRQATIEAQLDGHAELVAGADAHEADQVRQELAPVWRRQLERLLADDGGAAAELEALVAQVQRALPAAQQAWAHTVIQNITASGVGSVAAGTIGTGSVIYHTTAPRPADPAGDHGPGSGQ